MYLFCEVSIHKFCHFLNGNVSSFPQSFNNFLTVWILIFCLVYTMAQFPLSLLFIQLCLYPMSHLKIFNQICQIFPLWSLGSV